MNRIFDEIARPVVERVDQLRHEVDDHWQIPAVEARLIWRIVRTSRCVRLCEIGVSYGFSTLHLAAAARANGGHVHAIDISEKKIEAAGHHLREAGLADVVTLHLGDAREVLRSWQEKGLPRFGNAGFDFAFIDAVKEQSHGYLDTLTPLLGDQYTLLTDNTSTHHDQLAPFVQRLRELPNVTSIDVPVGNGFEWTVKE